MRFGARCTLQVQYRYCFERFEEQVSKTNQRTIVAVFSALKNKAKGKKAAPAKKAVAKKAVAKKAAPAKKAVAKKAPAKKAAPVKKVAPVKKPVKIEVKKDLTAKEVQQLVDLKNLVARHNEIVETLAASGIDNYRKAVKKEFMALALEARQLDVEIPESTEKARKALGASTILNFANSILVSKDLNLLSLKTGEKRSVRKVLFFGEGFETYLSSFSEKTKKKFITTFIR